MAEPSTAGRLRRLLERTDGRLDALVDAGLRRARAHPAPWWLVDALFLAARAALWDFRVSRMRAVEYKAPSAKVQHEGGCRRAAERLRHVCHRRACSGL